MKYFQVQISAENKEQADKILNSLLEKKLVTGDKLLTLLPDFYGKVKSKTWIITL